MAPSAPVQPWLRPRCGRSPDGLADRCGGYALDLDAVLAVDLLEMDADELLARRRDVLADVIGADRQLAVTPIDEHGKADRLRPPEVDQGVHRGADRAAGVQDVIDEHDRAPV